MWFESLWPLNRNVGCCAQDWKIFADARPGIVGHSKLAMEAEVDEFKVSISDKALECGERYKVHKYRDVVLIFYTPNSVSAGIQ